MFTKTEPGLALGTKVFCSHLCFSSVHGWMCKPLLPSTDKPPLNSLGCALSPQGQDQLLCSVPGSSPPLLRALLSSVLISSTRLKSPREFRSAALPPHPHPLLASETGLLQRPHCLPVPGVWYWPLALLLSHPPPNTLTEDSSPAFALSCTLTSCLHRPSPAL